MAGICEQISCSMASDGHKVAMDDVEANESDEQRGGSDVGRGKDDDATWQGGAS